jgi:hypothetical protein
VCFENPLASRCFDEQPKRALAADWMPGKVTPRETGPAYRDHAVARPDSPGEFSAARQWQQDVVDEFRPSQNRLAGGKCATENAGSGRRNIHVER